LYLIPGSILDADHQEFVDAQQSLALIGYKAVMFVKVLAFFQHFLAFIHFREVGRHLD
jgi:hypothetical protein